MKTGRPTWSAGAPPELLAAVGAALDARAESGRTIYTRLNLQRYVRYTSFTRWARRRRRGQAARCAAEAERCGFNQNGEEGADLRSQISDRSAADGAPAGAPAAGPTGGGDASLLDHCLAAISEAVLAGRTKVYELNGAVRALVLLERVRQLAEANRRAAELHELKLAELRSQIKQAVGQKSEEGSKTLTADEVYELVDKIMRGETA